MKKIRIVMKIAAIIILTGLLIWLIDTDETILQKKQPAGQLVKSEDIKILVDELVTAGENKLDKTAWENFRETHFLTPEENLRYEIYEELIDCLLGKFKQEKVQKIKAQLTYKEKYRADFYLLKEDWYRQFDILVKAFGLQEIIKEETVEILCSNEELTGTEQIGEGCLLGKTGLIYKNVSEDTQNLRFTKAKVYLHGIKILTLVETMAEEAVLSNAYLLQANAQGLSFFYKGYEITYSGPITMPMTEAEPQIQEQVADISYQEGQINDIALKEDTISGKLLTLTLDSLEIEGEGIFEIHQDCVGYQIFEELREASLQELTIGYSYTDFILEDGKVCAFLITRKEAMENIRVAIKNNGFGSLYHEIISLRCEDDMTIYYGAYDERRQETVDAGAELTITQGDKYLEGDRIEIVPELNTAKIQLLSIERSQGVPEYRGNIEIVETLNGLVLINELLLEEYLYSVVPSEMPASYPIEALKAQAICARTYAYRYLKKPGYAEVGAHVDDSVSYQVYNNIVENSNSTKAVRETTGILLLYNEEPADTYYYSTSCGFGTDAGIWNEERMAETPFIKSLRISEETGRPDGAGDEDTGELPITPEELMQEDNFEAYIAGADRTSYEKEEPWYRWYYEVETLDTALLYEKLAERYQAGPEKILTYVGDGDAGADSDSYESQQPVKFKKVYQLQSLKRRAGGIMDELLIVTDKGTYKVISEYNIRAVLNQGGEVVRQDESVVLNGTLLPSAYIAIDIVTSGKNVVGYTINGGGYGHGAGMSQNGARAMGIRGLSCEEILTFFFENCPTQKIY